MVTRALALALVVLGAPGCFLAWLVTDGSASGEMCPGDQRTTCREALTEGGSVCGTGAAADAYQGLVQCACTGDVNVCGEACGRGLCVGEVVMFPVVEGAGGGMSEYKPGDACWTCLATQCTDPYSACVNGD
jgi:hypothetical protein